MRRRPFGGKLSRALLVLLSGPTGHDRRVLGRPYTDDELARLDPAAPGWVGPVRADELAGRRRSQRREEQRTRGEMGRAAP
jgi:hypothetical protein